MKNTFTFGFIFNNRSVDLWPGVLGNNSGMVNSMGWNDGWNQLLVCPLESASYRKSMNLSSFVFGKGMMVSRLRELEEKSILGLAQHRPGLYKGSVVVKSKTWCCRPFLIYTHLSFRKILFHRNSNWLDVPKCLGVESGWDLRFWRQIPWFGILAVLLTMPLTRSLGISVPQFPALQTVVLLLIIEPEFLS